MRKCLLMRSIWSACILLVVASDEPTNTTAISGTFTDTENKPKRSDYAASRNATTHSSHDIIRESTTGNNDLTDSPPSLHNDAVDYSFEDITSQSDSSVNIFQDHESEGPQASLPSATAEYSISDGQVHSVTPTHEGIAAADSSLVENVSSISDVESTFVVDIGSTDPRLNVVAEPKKPLECNSSEVVVILEFTSNYTWNATLADENSTDYATFTTTLADYFTDVFKNSRTSAAYAGLQEVKLTNGSSTTREGVAVNVRLLFNVCDSHEHDLVEDAISSIEHAYTDHIYVIYPDTLKGTVSGRLEETTASSTPPHSKTDLNLVLMASLVPLGAVFLITLFAALIATATKKHYRR